MKQTTALILRRREAPSRRMAAGNDLAWGGAGRIGLAEVVEEEPLGPATVRVQAGADEVVDVGGVIGGPKAS